MHGLQATADRVTVSQISGAMTNLVYRCGYSTPNKVCAELVQIALNTSVWILHRYTKSEIDVALQKHHALARVFGSAGGLFGREDEQQVFSAVADAGLGPKVLVCASTLPFST